MTKEEIISSGFVKAFIRKYFEEQIHGYYPDKDRLLYILCENDDEKHKATKEQISKIKTKISDLGFEELSFTYLLSCNPESLINYIEPNERFEFWLNRFAEDFEHSINDFDEVTKAFCSYKNITELSVEAIEDEGDFWEIYPDTQKPEIEELVINIVEETELLSLIEYEIDEYKENKYWEIDFNEYQKYIAVSKPIELLLNFCELLVQLNRLEMFKEFLNIEQLPPQQTKTNTDQAIPNFENNFDVDEIIATWKRQLKIFPDHKNKKIFEEQISSWENIKELQDSFYQTYIDGIVKTRNLLIAGFEIALDGTIDQNKLIKMEIRNIDKILKGKLGKNLTILDWSKILKIEPENIKDSYEKLIRGLEITILQKNMDNNNLEEINNLRATRALLFFKDYLTTLTNPLPPQQAETPEHIQKELNQISQAENKFLKGVNMQIVIDHFKVFTTSKNKKGEYYLTGDQFISFLKKCFLNDMNEPIQKINFANGEKGFVIKRFYKFYEIACSKYHVHNSKAPFIDRFTECFEFGKKSTFISAFQNNKTNKQW